MVRMMFWVWNILVRVVLVVDSSNIMLTSLCMALVLVIGMLVFDHIYYVSNPKVAITCSSNISLPSTGLVHNNVQASHSYTDFVGHNGIQYCFVADDLGVLWGNSMQPTFFEGNTVLTKNFTANMSLRTGDVVRYFRFDGVYKNCTSLANISGGAIIHRISAIYDDRIVVQGDNLNEQETIQRCQIRNIVIGIIYT